MDDYFPTRHKRRIIDLNIVPILDMLTTVIFFLLLSTSFMEYTKLTVPPSGVAVITDPLVPPPLGPKLILFKAGKELKAMLTWVGSKPGEAMDSVPITDLDETRVGLVTLTRKMSKEFITKFPKEKTLQMGLSPKLPYQYLIAGMDGVRENMPDIVLISPLEVAARSRQFKAEE